ncbi:MarR family winged helix-turn-helix transcriptional regulator [Propylenella binzhouense]|uniref:MarR family transcriptional regulator n=1 Tax=Propylenella binzhouense TaxID=2555902 RepID=A0A964WTM2_9HYPH|nr:MarR family transcriptional regulator [Propylenella binzhouense]MYZ48005.1 MarR family transcriptional regulator [Propylenella binzhouense]
MDHDQVSDSVSNLVVDLARLFRQRMDEAFAAEGLDLTPGEGRTLLRIARNEPIRQNVLAERLGIEPMTVSGFVDRLERRGLVARETDPADRRAKLVRSLPAAAPLVAHLDAVVAGLRERALSGFSRAEGEAVRRALVRMRANLATEALAPA